MFPEGFAKFWIEELTNPGQVVLDPFCGRGTTPFQALLMGRRAIAIDVNPVAFCLTFAKTNSPSLGALTGRLTRLERAFDKSEWRGIGSRLPPFFRVAFRPKVLQTLFYLRETLNWRESPVDCMIAALVLGILHGEAGATRPYLSNQMPRTISTKPAYSIRYWEQHELTAPNRDVFEELRKQANFRYESVPPRRTGEVFLDDMRDLPRLIGTNRKIQCAITSPPYRDVTHFEEDQWLRLWFLGGPPRPTHGLVSRDDRLRGPDLYWRMIGDMWRTLGLVLSPDSNIVIRLGSRTNSPEELVEALKGSGVLSRRKLYLQSYEVSEIKRRQTHSFRPGTKGCRVEVDCHFSMT